MIIPPVTSSTAKSLTTQQRHPVTLVRFEQRSFSQSSLNSEEVEAGGSCCEKFCRYLFECLRNLCESCLSLFRSKPVTESSKGKLTPVFIHKRVNDFFAQKVNVQQLPFKTAVLVQLDDKNIAFLQTSITSEEDRTAYLAQLQTQTSEALTKITIGQDDLLHFRTVFFSSENKAFSYAHTWYDGEGSAILHGGDTNGNLKDLDLFKTWTVQHFIPHLKVDGKAAEEFIDFFTIRYK